MATYQQVDEELLSRRRVTLSQTHQSAADPGDAVTRQSQQGDRRPDAAPRGRGVDAHAQTLGQADVDGQQRVDGDAFEGRVEQHAVFVRRLHRVLTRLVLLALGRAGFSPRFVVSRRHVQGQKLGAAQNAAAIFGSGATRVQRHRAV